ncbi:uncharacterized protein M6B38_104515 [Iris pallida]|uniref:Uncharacterized protein n=1 Tax=Iris pallida TaxID=29817 RepID=A0AAX6F3M8_IRIPA|nr:uncharacterized protein M6B38_104515 [Iris pallida]
MRHIPLRNEANSPGPTSFLDSQSRYHTAVRNEGEVMRSGYDDGYDQRDQAPRTQELLESDVISSEQKEEKNSPRCDSQSSLSVSNPPSSPTHLSHDGFDEADDNPALETLVVEEHTFISHNDHTASEMEVRNTNTMGTSSTVSQEEDDEWAIEKNEMNEQEDYDEEDGYREEEEAVHDGDGGETLEDVQEFDDPPSVSPNRTGEDVQMVLDCNEVVGSSIDTVGGSEKTSRNNEKGTGVQDDSAGDHSLQDDSAFTEGLVSESSKKIMNETEKALQELTLDPLPVPTSSSPESTEASSTQGASIQQSITSGLSPPMAITSTVQSTTSTVSAVEFQAEAPIRLQFGLFSGPSLIPSPVPAIQIGSIQMPLHLPPPQPPFFQFGQLRYPSPLSQGILPLAPPTMSFVQPLASAQYSPSQNLGGSLHSQGKGPSSQNSAPDKVPSGPPENQPGVVTKSLDLSQGNINYKLHDELSNPLNGEIASRGQTIISFHGEDKARNISGYQNERHIVHDINVRKNYRPMSHNKEPQVYPGHAPSQISTGERTQIGSGATGIISNSRGRRFTYNARNASTRPLFPAPETSRTDSSGFQRRPRRSVRRTEFRVRENVDRREREHLEPYSSVNQEARPNFSGRISGSSARYGVRKDDEPTKLTKKTVESENLNSGVSSTYAASSSGKVDELSGREALSKKRVSSFENLQAGEGSGKKNVSSQEDVGAPLQSGVVCVFRQPGIEAPSDEDDFIEVRSKRQMLNDRREQREKEIKAKSKVIKAPRKHQTVPQSNVVAYNFKKSANSFVGDATNNLRSDAVISDGRDFPSVEASPIFTTNMTSQSLPPIGTPAAKVDSDARFINLKSPSCVPGTSSCAMLVPGLPFEKKNTVLVNASLPSGSWSNSDINQQVMALTQSQLDDAMKPVLFDSNVTSSISLEPTKSSTSIMAQEKKSFPTSASPLNSLLAGERIQFGAVTSPTILPPISRAISNGIAPPRFIKIRCFKGPQHNCYQ